MIARSSENPPLFPFATTIDSNACADASAVLVRPVQKNLLLAFEGLSAEHLQKILECLPLDTLDGLARHAAYQRNIALFKAVMAADKGEAVNPNPPWAQTGSMFSSSTSVEVDRLATCLLARDAPYESNVDSDETSQWHRYPIRALPVEMVEHLRGLIKDCLEAFESVDGIDSELTWMYAASLNLLLTMTLAFDLVDDSRRIIHCGPDNVQEFFLNHNIATVRPGSPVDGDFNVKHSLLALLNGGPEAIELLRTSGQALVNNSRFIENLQYSDRAEFNKVLAEPLLSCAYNDGQYLSFFHLIHTGVISVRLSRIAELVSGVRSEHIAAVALEAQTLFSVEMGEEDLSELVASGLYKLNPADTAVFLCIRGLFDELATIAPDVDWILVNEKGLTTAQRCIWHVLNQYSSNSADGTMFDQVRKVMDIVSRHVDLKALLLRKDPKGSTLFAQVAKSGNLQALGHSMGLLSGLSSTEALAAVEMATGHMDQLSSNSAKIKALAKDRMRAWVAGLAAREALADMAGVPCLARSMAHS